MYLYHLYYTLHVLHAEHVPGKSKNILHLPGRNGTRFTCNKHVQFKPRKFLQSAKEFSCYTIDIMCVVIYISSQVNCTMVNNSEII